MNEKTRNTVTVALFVTSIVLIVAGVLQGEHMTVLTKAVHLCMQCIGIG